jgi:hypothetical protein
MKEERQEKGRYLQYERETSVNPGLHIRIRIIFGSWIPIRIETQNSKALEAHHRAVDAHNGSLEAQNGVYRSVVADSHHFDEEQDPDPGLY